MSFSTHVVALRPLVERQRKFAQLADGKNCLTSALNCYLYSTTSVILAPDSSLYSMVERQWIQQKNADSVV